MINNEVERAQDGLANSFYSGNLNDKNRYYEKHESHD